MLVLCQGKDEMLGRCSCVPVVKLKSSMDCGSVKLQWESVMNKQMPAGELLVAAELFLKVRLCFIVTHRRALTPVNTSLLCCVTGQ